MEQRLPLTIYQKPQELAGITVESLKELKGMYLGTKLQGIVYLKLRGLSNRKRLKYI